MGRVFTYVLFTTMLLVILEFSGLGLLGSRFASEIGFTSDSVNTGIDLESTSIWTIIFGAAGILAVVTSSIAIGYLIRSSPENYVVLPFITANAIMFADVFIGLLKQIGSYPIYISAVLITIFLAIGVGFMVTMIEWFRGNI